MPGFDCFGLGPIRDSLLGDRIWDAAHHLWNIHVLQVRKVKAIFENLNKVFENRVRLTVMSILAVNDSMDFNSLKKMLTLTDGNLATHIATLERKKYIKVEKEFVGKKTLTTYSATQAGRKAFSEHIDAMEKLIKQCK
jgi:DNA-binding MarR family transcriptional regulator